MSGLNARSLLTVSVLGNALEFFDLTLCGVFVIALGKTFFPETTPFITIIQGLFVFSAAFWTRPLGAVVFGRIGDQFGRKRALSLSILGMAFPTLCIALLPGYAHWGVISPCILLICRMIQGLCTGGEYNGAAIFSLEHLKERPGLVSGIISASCVMGAFSATVCGSIFTQESFSDQAWRIPFLIGAVSGLIGFYIRRRLHETDDFLALTEEQKTTAPLRDVLTKHRPSFLLAVSSGAYNGVLSYTLFGFLAIYLSRYVGLSVSNSLTLTLYGMGAFLLGCPFFGHLCDRLGVRRVMRFIPWIGIFASSLGFFLMMRTTAHSFLFSVGQISLGLAVASFVGPSHVFLQSLFPSAVRYTGVAVGFSLGMALTGSTTAFFLSIFLEKSGWLIAPAAYIGIAALLWKMALSRYLKNDASHLPANEDSRNLRYKDAS